MPKSDGRNSLRGESVNAHHSVGTDPHNLMIIAILMTVGCTLFMAVCGFRPNPRAHLTQEELDDARVKKEENNEGRIQIQIRKLEKRLKGSRMRKAALEGGKESEKLIETRKEEWDVKGKAVYGDAWDEETDGNLPMKDLFSLPEEELREIKIEAYNKAATSKREVEEVERTARISARENERIDLNTARSMAMGSTTDSSLSMMDGARRKHKPAADAPFHDPRFVSRPSAAHRPGGAGQWGSGTSVGEASGGGQFASRLDAPPPPAAVPVQVAPELLDFRSRTDVHMQAPGLAKPRPPPAQPAHMQEPGLARPKPPPPLPTTTPPKKKKAAKRRDEDDDSLGSIFKQMNNGGIK